MSLKWKVVGTLFVGLVGASPVVAQTRIEEASQGGKHLAYPATRRVDHVETLHGVDVSDPFRWLEGRTKERSEWIRAQDELCRSQYAEDPQLEPIRERLVELYHYARAPVPRKAGGRWFVDGQRPSRFNSDIRMYDELGGEPRLLVDPDAHPASPNHSVGLSAPLPSPDGEFVLYSASSRSLPSCLRVLEVESGEELVDEVISGTMYPWSVAWMPDSSGFVYVQGSSVRLHYLGMPSSDDLRLFGTRAIPAPTLAVRVAADETSLFVTEHAPNDDTTRIHIHELGMDTDSGSPTWVELTPDRAGHYQIVGKVEDEILLYTTADAPRGRIMALNLEQPQFENWREVVPEMEEPLWDGNHPIRPSVGLFDGHLALLYVRDAGMLLRAFDLEGQPVSEAAHPLGFNESGLLGRSDEAVVRYDVQSMVDPGAAYEMDLRTGETRRLGTSSVPFDPDDFVMERVFYESFDGARVPLFLARRKDIELDGKNAVLINHRSGSGGVARSLYLPVYQAWLEMGGIFALPGLRGGGEYGTSWHKAGIGPNLPNAVQDLVHAARHLVEAGISRPEHIAIAGMSASGPVAASALVHHPQDFGAAILRISHLDMLRHSSSIEMFGNPKNAEDFGHILQWTPYTRLANDEPRSRRLPGVLIQTGDNDNIAPPFHSYKLTAALQAAQKGPRPVLLQVAWGAGHSQGFGVAQQCETYALQHAFLARELGLRSLLGGASVR